VDDNATIRALVRQIFEVEPDFEVSGEAENGREGLEKAVNLDPDVVILDLVMPVMNGFDAAADLSRLLPDTRIILFTVEEGGEVERLAREAGVHAVVTKHEACRLILEARSLLASSVDESDPGELRNAS
jgi:NarL family two-component system response regulator LiaR